MLGIGTAGPLGRAAMAEPATGRRAADDPPSFGAAGAGGGRDPERDADDEALAVLVSVDGLGPATLGRLLARVGNPRRLLDLAAASNARAQLLEASEGFPTSGRLEIPVIDAIVNAAARAPRILDAIGAAGLELVTVLGSGYPARLRQIELPPHVLFVAGDRRALDAARAVAVVGTRHPTDAGRRNAARIAAALARCGVNVVSGLAVGIDGAAHAAVVAEGGRTVAVLGGGHGHLYPRVHRGLAEAIVASGGAVVSEFAPDVKPRAGTFPRRNRLISGLSEATIVIEAGERSGALTTAAWALEQGRGCFLAPGAIDAPMSAGCLAFLREYPTEARVVAGIPQLLEDLGLAGERMAGLVSPQGVRRPLSPVRAAAVLASLGLGERKVADALIEGFSTVDELVARADLPVGAVLAALTLLESRELVFGAYGRYRPSGLLASADPPRAKRRGMAPA